MAGIYIHIPFCKRKCIYCDFYSTAQPDRYGADFVGAAVREISGQRGFLAGAPVETVYFGGGTPSLLDHRDIALLFRTVRENYDTTSLSEITLEANPEDLGSEYLTALSRSGVNRLSIGIQSFDDDILAFMRRRHNGAKAVSSVRQAQDAGFGNIGIDLIYGIPGMDLEGWEKTLEQALELKPEHISAYHLTFQPGTTLGKMKEKGEISEIPDRESLHQFEMLHRILSAAGYEHYEVSNFALPGYRSRHNSAYWTGKPYLGIGPGAHSYNGTERQWCSMSVKDYVTAPAPEYEMEILSADDRYNELVMVSLRTVEGLDAGKIGAQYTEHFLKESERLVRSGRLRRHGNRYHIPPQDFLSSDSVISSLFI